MKCRCCNNRIAVDPVSDKFVNIFTIKNGKYETGIELSIEDAERLVYSIMSEIIRIRESSNQTE